MPATVPNSGNASVVVYGSGFDSTTVVHVDDVNSGYQIRTSYVSPDGTVAVFVVPSYATVGSHSLILNNTYASNATSSPTAPLTITVSSN